MTLARLPNCLPVRTRHRCPASAQPEEAPDQGQRAIKLYHRPGTQFYDSTVAEIWFATDADAEAAGWLPPSQRDERSLLRDLLTTDPATDDGGGVCRLRLDIGYDGTDFSGWALQPGRRTVAGVLTDTLTTVLREPVRLTVAGRTDAGVHATGQVAHLDVGRAALDTRSIHGDPSTLVRRLAKMLPDDVRIKAVTEVPVEFDARFSALRRHYVYRLADALWGSEPVTARTTGAWPRPLDVEALNAAAAALLGLRDFAALLPAPARIDDDPRPASVRLVPHRRRCADRPGQR